MSDERREYWRGRRRTQRIPRQVVLLIIILVGMLVLLYYFRAWLDELSAGGGGTTTASVATEVELVLEPILDERAIEVPVAAEGPASGAALSGPVRIVVLPARAESFDPAALTAVDVVRQATLRALRATEYIDVVDLSESDVAGIAPADARGLRENVAIYLAVTRRYRADVVAEIFERSGAADPEWVVRLHLRWPASSRSSAGNLSRNGNSSFGDDATNLGEEFADIIARPVVEHAILTRSAGEGRSILLDSTRTEETRMGALLNLANAGLLEGETLATAVAFTSSVPSSDKREGLWRTIRLSAFDPALGQSMSYALLTDPHAGVRREVAIGLSGYRADGGVEPALEHASRTDSSAEVRLAARMAMMDYGEQQAFKRETLFDRSLTPAQRVAPSMIFRGTTREPLLTSFDREAAETALAYVEIVNAAEDSQTRFDSIAALYGIIASAPPFTGPVANVDPMVTRALIVSADIGDSDMRRVALQALTALVDVPEVRTALGKVLEEEPELAAELQIAEVLDRGLR